MIEMRVMGIALDTRTGSPIVVLHDKDNRKALPIWIGSAEASAIIRKIENLQVARPMTHDLIIDIIKKTGYEVLNSTLPYLHDDNYSISYFQNKNRTKQTLVFEKVKNYIDLNKINYSIWANCDEIKEIKDKNGNKITFSLEKNLQNRYCIYKTEYVEKK